MANAQNNNPPEEDSGIIPLDDQLGFHPMPMISRIFHDFEKDLERFFSPLWYPKMGFGPRFPLINGARMPNIDLIDNGDHFKVLADLPGYTKKDIDIEIYPSKILLRGKQQLETEDKRDHYIRRERRRQEFQRYIRLPAKIKPEDAKAKMNNGILEITLPKQKPTSTEKPRKLTPE
ncbi:MAG: Hsp20/alpha crystallin family protein [Candidatus Ranarchaeia archaeon]